ncbi:uncharacterized protein Z518_06773 [Rhinocladiella mackenziei CBS 650.93]|uniref:Rhinocladiella mackenziei CBS 650.93 unplaced genomic scaffold supercont1.5, whole genome shotgun sequence n=1 Tax=Rhinocladiella mackenziei CBS 650.93 TaxID=1442369 RepID=A0A0D2IIV0_9EURO|nr:uncharacterized protein Z518_06773 [Rhinocladiella mackenziei CBS 650.93]KIX03221.1 hypothetical protein Z518_06773 [Rhinocladiella mackenziei CBS 650.93]
MFDTRLAAIYHHSTISDKNLESVKHSRMSSNGKTNEPTFEMKPLYGGAVPKPEAQFLKWASA